MFWTVYGKTAAPLNLRKNSLNELFLKGGAGSGKAQGTD